MIESGASIGREQRIYTLLNDQPVRSRREDLLATGDIAQGIASLLIASRASSPFVLAVDAGWGMGKSTLLRQIESYLPNDDEIVRAHFNAWTAEGNNALEGLIKTVLGELDPNTVRRWVRRLARQRKLILAARIGFSLAARFFGLARLIDELWIRLGGDAKSRNEMRDLIHGMLSDWISSGVGAVSGRALLVFIDDLDRCPDDVIVKVCEAVKLYLDVPGLIFVVACDQSALARGVSSSARGGAGEGRMYLEKIVQVVYRLPPPEEAQAKKLIAGYAQQSGTAELIDENVAILLAEGSGRNPRKIKRIINSFVLEHRLNRAWQELPSGSAQLVRAVLLQHLYPSFYEWLVREDTGDDPIGIFLDYAEVHEGIAEPPADRPDDPWWAAMRRVFRACRLAPRFPNESAEKEIGRLERELPENFPILVRDSSFVALLKGIGDNKSRRLLRAQLIRRPLMTARVTGDSAPFILDQMHERGSEDSGILSQVSELTDVNEIDELLLSKAVRSAYAQGFRFGKKVVQEYPTSQIVEIWKHKPSLSSSLEKEMLQGSEIEYQWFRRNDVVSALRRGFWDALKPSTPAGLRQERSAGGLV